MRGTEAHSADHCWQNTYTKRAFSTVKTRIRVFSPTSFIGEKGSDKALRVSSLGYDVAQCMNILTSLTLNGLISGFFSLLSFFHLLAFYFFIS
jgi:hypothetical protein